MYRFSFRVVLTDASVLYYNMSAERSLYFCLRSLTTREKVINRNFSKLHFAAESGFREIVECLIEWCPELGTLKDHNGNLAIHLATARGHLDCIKYLCMPETINVSGNNGRTALHYAIAHGDAAAVKYLIDHNADVDSGQPHRLRNPPLIAALQRKNRIISRILIDGKANIEIADHRGWRPLHFAARYGYTALASRLLDLECERQPQTHLGETPFFLAISFGRGEIIKLFLDNDMGTSDVEPVEGLTYAYVAASCGRLDVLHELVKTNRGVIFKTTAAGVDALYVAALLGYHTIVDFLIRSGIKPSGMGRFVDIPLAGAAGNGCIQTVDTLLRLGAGVNETDLWQRTPLSRAVEQGYLNIANRLLKAGANPHIRDATGFTAFDYCANNPPMMDVLRPWRSVSRIYGIPPDPNERLCLLISCIIRSARAISQNRRDSSHGEFQVSDTMWHVRVLRSSLFRLGMFPFTSPCLRAPKLHTAVPAKRAEILREWRVIFADSQDIIYCGFCGVTLLDEFYACSICESVICEVCFPQLKLGTQPYMNVRVWEELKQLEGNVNPISKALIGLAYQDARVVAQVLAQDNLLRHWVLAKRQEYAKWKTRWGLHHFRTAEFHGWNIVHTMARVLTQGQDLEKSDDVGSSDASETEQCNTTRETCSDLTERWQNAFVYGLVDQDFSDAPCTHRSFLKVSKDRESLGEPQTLFDSTGKLTSEAFDLLAKKYEECLTSEDLNLENLQKISFADSLVESPPTSENRFGHAIDGQDVLGAAEDSCDETTSVESASDSSSDVTDVSVVSDVGDEVQIDIEEALEKLLVKRGTLQQEKLFTEEDDLVLETAWKFVQAIVYHDTPRQSLKDIAEQGSEWHTAPGTPVAFCLGGSSGPSSHYSTAGSI